VKPAAKQEDSQEGREMAMSGVQPRRIKAGGTVMALALANRDVNADRKVQRRDDRKVQRS